MFIVPPRRSATCGIVWPAVDVEEPGERDVVGAVAAADGEHVDVVAPEVLGDAIELVDAVGLAHHADVAEARGPAGLRRGGRAGCACCLGLRTTPMPGTSEESYRTPQRARVNPCALRVGPFAAYAIPAWTQRSR